MVIKQILEIYIGAVTLINLQKLLHFPQEMCFESLSTRNVRSPRKLLSEYKAASASCSRKIRRSVLLLAIHLYTDVVLMGTRSYRNSPFSFTQTHLTRSNIQNITILPTNGIYSNRNAGLYSFHRQRETSRSSFIRRIKFSV